MPDFSRAANADHQVKCDEMNFVVKAENLAETTNQGLCQSGYRDANTTKIVQNLANHLKAIWEHVSPKFDEDRERLGANYLASDESRVDSALKALYREEYETWQLISELIQADNVFFGCEKRQILEG